MIGYLKDMRVEQLFDKRESIINISSLLDNPSNRIKSSLSRISTFLGELPMKKSLAVMAVAAIALMGANAHAADKKMMDNMPAEMQNKDMSKKMEKMEKMKSDHKEMKKEMKDMKGDHEKIMKDHKKMMDEHKMIMDDHKEMKKSM